MECIHKGPFGRFVYLVVLGAMVAASAACGRDRDGWKTDRIAESNTGQGLRLAAKPIRSNVETDGPLLVEIEIRNESDSAIEFHPSFTVGAQWLNADITDSVGTPINLTASIFEPYAVPITLGAGHVLRDTVDLRCDIGTWEAPEHCVPPYAGLFDPGAYSITMRFVVPCPSCTEHTELVARAFNVRVVDSDSAGK